MTTSNKMSRIIAGDGSDLPARQKYSAEEKEAMRKHRRRLAKRAEIGKDWDGRADNDNIAWPLATALIREGNTELLKAAMAYRRIHDQAKREARLGGSGVSMRDGFSLDRHTTVRANGTVAYKHVRQSTAASVDIPAKQYVAPPAYEKITDDAAPVRNQTNIPKPWNGDKPVNDMIDSKRELARLQARLGHLCEPFEMSVVDGATYQEVGNSLGVANRAGAMGAGRAAVHLGLITVRDALGKIDRKDLAA